MLREGAKIPGWMNGESLMRRTLRKTSKFFLQRKKGTACNTVRVTIVAITYWLNFLKCVFLNLQNRSVQEGS